MISPILKHAIESFEHGLEHYLDGTELSRKFAILHIDQSIELFLKERIVNEGKSIHKSNGTTLSIHEAFNSLKSICDIVERPRLEELHHIRNTIQHRGFIPDIGTTKFYIQIAYDFAKRFLSSELNINLLDVLPKQYQSLMEGKSALKETPKEIVQNLQDIKTSNDEPVNRILSAYILLERTADALPPIMNKANRRILKATIREAAMKNGHEKNDINKALNFIMAKRGEIVHKDGEPIEQTKKDAKRYVKIVEELINMTIGLDKEELN